MLLLSEASGTTSRELTMAHFSCTLVILARHHDRYITLIVHSIAHSKQLLSDCYY
jgi:hypothetical protein